MHLLEDRLHYNDSKLAKNKLVCSTAINEYWSYFLGQKSLCSSPCKLLALYPLGPVEDQPQIYVNFFMKWFAKNSWWNIS